MDSVSLIPLGEPASAALVERIRAAKAGDPLAPVTVAVPSNYTGLAQRRALGLARGLVNVRFMVLNRVFELLGAPALAAAGRRPLTPLIRREAVRAALSEGPGFFAPIAGHAATVRSLEQSFRDLRGAPPEGLRRLAASGPRAAAVVAIYERFRAATAGYYDTADLAAAAAVAVHEGSAALRDIGQVIVFLPRGLAPAEADAIHALAARSRAHVILGLALDQEADAVTARLGRTLGVAVEPVRSRRQVQPGKTEIIAVTDPEEEMRAVVRRIASEVEHVPLHRMAVLYRVPEPYAVLAHEQFQAADVPHNGPGSGSLTQSVAGRSLLGLLRLRESDFRRDAVMDWLTSAPAPDSAEFRHARRWDVLSRAAGITSGISRWRPRLERHARRLERRAAEAGGPEGESWHAGRLTQDAAAARTLAGFIDHLGLDTDTSGRESWQSFAGWCERLLDRYVVDGRSLPLGSRAPAELRDREANALEQVRAALAELRSLGDALPDRAPAVTEPVFRRALEAALEAPAPRLAPFGDGVFVGPLSSAAGMDFDLVFVLGMVEGQMPPVGREDPLLPDEDRRALDGLLPLVSERRAGERRDYLAALASSPRHVLLFPRADLRSQSENLPARWLLDAATDLASAAAGIATPVFSREFGLMLNTPEGAAGAGSPWLTSVASFSSAIVRGPEAGSIQEYDLRRLALAPRAESHFLVRENRQVAGGIAASRARAGRDVSEWDGLLAPDPDRAPSDQHPSSPTALETWATCPFRYLLRTVLHVAETERPEDTLSISAADRGTLLHRVLQAFFAGDDNFQPAAPRTSREQPWTAAERDWLATIARFYCGEAEEAGLTGKPLLWRVEQRRILRDLDLFLDAELERRRTTGFVFDCAEFTFGTGSEPALEVRLPGNRCVAFRGSIDRVDRLIDGDGIAVIDYKSGSPDRFRGMAANPLKYGQLLQLPIYALAAARRSGAQSVDAAYWFISERHGYVRYGNTVRPDDMNTFVETAGAIVDGIEGGVFPARPGNYKGAFRTFENCGYCPYDALCPRDRGRAWRRKRDSATIATYTALAEPVRDDDDG